jgi:hypothetical protein
LIIRKKKEISLERAKRHSPIWRHKADIDEKSVNQEDLVICKCSGRRVVILRDRFCVICFSCNAYTIVIDDLEIYSFFNAKKMKV